MAARPSTLNLYHSRKWQSTRHKTTMKRKVGQFPLQLTSPPQTFPPTVVTDWAPALIKAQHRRPSVLTLLQRRKGVDQSLPTLNATIHARTDLNSCFPHRSNSTHIRASTHTHKHARTHTHTHTPHTHTHTHTHNTPRSPHDSRPHFSGVHPAAHTRFQHFPRVPWKPSPGLHLQAAA